MPITLVTGPANAGKAQVVMDGVRAHLAHGEEPLLIVPTRADAEHYLRELAGERAAVGARVERFDGLIEETVRRAGVGQPLLGSVARRRLLASIAGPQATPGFVGALADLLDELRVRRVTPAALARALEEWTAQDGPGASRAELALLYERYQQRMQQIGRLDGAQRAVRALDALRRRPSLWGATPVLFYGFDDLTRLQLDAIETLGRVVDARVTVSLAYEPGRTAFGGRAGTFAALAPLAGEHRALEARAEYYAPAARRALAHLERSLFELDVRRVDPGRAVRLLEGGGERAEIELVAEEVSALLAGGMAPQEIAVVHRAPASMADLIEEVFTAAGIPFALQRRRRFGDSSLGRALLGVLRCVEDGGEPVGELNDLLAWLRAPGLLERPELADQLELRARRTGAVSARQARELWERRHWRLESIDQLGEAARTGPAALLDRVSRELSWLFAAPRRGTASVLDGEGVAEARALAAGTRALRELRELARIAPDLLPASPRELAGTLEEVEFLSGEGAGPGMVAVLDPLALRARRVRALFLCGLQEGVFPARGRPEVVLGEEERRRLAETSGLRLGEHVDPLAAERYLLYAAVSRPRELLVLSWHVADDDGGPTARSLFVEDVCDLYDASLGEHARRRALGAVDPAPRAATPVRKLPAGSSTLRDERVLRTLNELVWSASSLERWVGCPVAWFVERLLRPGAIDPDAEPLARGGLAHAALRDTLEGLRRETGSARVTRGSLQLARKLLHAALAANESAFPLSSAPERRPGARRRLGADLERYLEHAATADSPLEPLELELGFGFDADDERGEGSVLGAFDLGGGVMMRGRIDRVDVGAGGEAVVYDYKARSAPPAARWLEDGALQVALYMLAVEDLLGLSAAGGFYQPLSGADLRARGLFDGESGVELDCVAGDVRDRAEVCELLAQALATARAAAAEAAGGELEARPQSCAYSGGCRYPTICRCER